MSMSVCLFVWLSERSHNSKTNTTELHQILCMSSSMARFYSDGVAISTSGYKMTLSFHILGPRARIKHGVIITSSRRGVRSIVMSMSVCLFVCLSSCITRKLHIIFGACYLWPCSVLVWQRFDMLTTSGFVDDITFLWHRGPMGQRPESSITSYFDKVQQVAAPVGHQTTTRPDSPLTTALYELITYFSYVRNVVSSLS